MPSRKYVVVNADDFGASRGVNRGILEAHVHGIVTSASLMVRQLGASDAAALALEHPSLGVGLHLDLAEWDLHDGEWKVRYEVVPAEDASAVAAEIDRQIAEFHRLLGRGPTHLDSHQHVHRQDPCREALLARARELGVPVRECTPGVVYRGDFYGQGAEFEPLPEGITVEAMLALLSEAGQGVTELGCHPGFADDLDSRYRAERAAEVRVLCDPRLKDAVAALGITLCSFGGGYLPRITR